MTRIRVERQPINPDRASSSGVFCRRPSNVELSLFLSSPCAGDFVSTQAASCDDPNGRVGQGDCSWRVRLAAIVATALIVR